MNIIEIILEIKVKFKRKLHKIITFKKQMGKTNSMWINEKKNQNMKANHIQAEQTKNVPTKF